MDKRIYERCKDGVLSEFKEFDKYAGEVNSEAERLIHERFDIMFERIKSNLDVLSAEEVHQIVDIMSKDKDVPDVLIEVISGIGLVKYVDENKGNNSEKGKIARIMLEFLSK